MAIDKGYGGMGMGGNRLMRRGQGGMGGLMGSNLLQLMGGGMGGGSPMNMDQTANYFTQALQQNQANPGSVDPNIMAQAANFARTQRNPGARPGDYGMTPGGGMLGAIGQNPAFRQPNWQGIFGPVVDRYQAAADAANQPQPSNFRENTDNVLRTIGVRLGGLGRFLDPRRRQLQQLQQGLANNPGFTGGPYNPR